MNRALLFPAVLFVSFTELLSQSPTPARSWIYLRDKPAAQSLRPPQELAREYGITSRSLQRRSKVLPPDQLIDHDDLPVAPEYIRQIEAAGLVVKSVSRWLNAVSVEASPDQLNFIRLLPFVAETRPVAALAHPPTRLTPLAIPSLHKRGSAALDYGPSFTQLSNIRVTDLHALGIDGSGVLVGMIDDGFNNHRSHVALEDIDVVDEYNFIHRIPSTQRQPWESSIQGNHGAATLSALAGFEEGMLVGAAYRASLILAKTEMDSVEVQAEEDLYVEALEWMEQLGAEVVSTSLGYVDWYPYDSLNGSIAITTKAARIAAGKGVLLVTAMGNEGWYQKDSTGKVISGLTGTLIAPADADTILAVGATHSDGEIAAFSSTGPAADGRVKPDIVSQGVGVIAASGETLGGFISANGTSLATPLTAGTAALLLSARPELTPYEVREAILQTARQIDDPFDPSRSSVYPNNYYGHGMVDAYRALLYHGVAMSSRPRVTQTDSTLSVHISIISDMPLIADSLNLIFQASAAGAFQQAALTPTTVQNLFKVTIPRGPDTAYPRGYVRARDASGRVRNAPYNAPDSLYIFSEWIVSNVPGVDEVPTEFVLHQNFPNPFNAGTMVSFDAPGVSAVEVHIFDLLGRKIKTLYQGPSTAGSNTFTWDGTNAGGVSVSTGIYIIRLQFADGVLSRKMLLLR